MKGSSHAVRRHVDSSSSRTGGFFVFFRRGGGGGGFKFGSGRVGSDVLVGSIIRLIRPILQTNVSWSLILRTRPLST